MSLTRREAVVALAAAPLSAALAAPEGVDLTRTGPDDPRWAHDARLAQVWRCTFPDCTPHYYDPLVGEPDHDIPPGTAFEDLPDDYWCPDCGTGKADFVPDVNRAEL